MIPQARSAVVVSAITIPPMMAWAGDNQTKGFSGGSTFTPLGHEPVTK